VCVCACLIPCDPETSTKIPPRPELKKKLFLELGNAYENYSIVSRNDLLKNVKDKGLNDRNSMFGCGIKFYTIFFKGTNSAYEIILLSGPISLEFRTAQQIFANRCRSVLPLEDTPLTFDVLRFV